MRIEKRKFHDIGNLSNNIFYKKRINYQLSLCFGIRWLYYKTMASGSVVKGIAKYNGGGDENYMKKIRKTLTENKKDIQRYFMKHKLRSTRKGSCIII